MVILSFSGSVREFRHWLAMWRTNLENLCCDPNHRKYLH